MDECTDYNPDLQILEYLNSQEIEGELDLQALLEQEHEFRKTDVRNILNCIVSKIEERSRNRKEHEDKVKAHNQYPLFDLSKVIQDAYLDDELYNKLIFRETLVVSKVNRDNTLTTVGGLSLDVQSAKGMNPLERKFREPTFKECLEIPQENLYWGEKSAKAETISEIIEQSEVEELKTFVQEVKKKLHRSHTKFLVHLHSQLDVDGRNGGSRLSSWVDRNLHTLEEKRKEFILEENQNLREKTLYVALQKDKYYVKYKSRPENDRNKKFYSFGKTKHYISEGANFILMRFLAIWRYYGVFEMSTMYINGDMCRNIYVCNGPEGGVINGKRVDLCRIYRVIIEECGIEHKSHTLMTLSGQIIKHEWDDCDYVVHINPLATVTNEKPRIEGNVSLKNMWQSDMQLFSYYLDEKNVNSMLVKSYLLDHPELNNVLADYIQHILTLKPADILEFTINHFKNFAPHFFPKNDYYETNYVEEEEMFTI